MMKYTVDELLRLACIHADEDRSSFLEAISCYQNSDKPEDREYYEETKSYLEQLRAYRLKRWGMSKSERLGEIPQEPLSETLRKCRGET